MNPRLTVSLFQSTDRALLTDALSGKISIHQLARNELGKISTESLEDLIVYELVRRKLTTEDWNDENIDNS